jgi:hypothetical protein
MNKRILDYGYVSIRILQPFYSLPDTRDNANGIYDIIVCERDSFQDNLDDMLQYAHKDTKILIDIISESGNLDNFIDIFLPEKELKDLLNKKIITDATALEDPKDPNASTVYALYQLVASAQQSEEMRTKLLAGGYGWGHAKKDLLEAILTRFSKEREQFKYYMNDTAELDNILNEGAEKARKVAKSTLSRVRSACGY